MHGSPVRDDPPPPNPPRFQALLAKYENCRRT